MIHVPDSLAPDIRRALSASAAGDSATALELLACAARDQPGSAIPHYLMAAEQAALGRVEQAEHSFANALLVQPSMTMARFQLGLLQFSSDRAALALLTWQPLAALGPAHALPHFVAGFEALAHDRLDQVRVCFAEGLRLNTENPALNADMRKVLADIDTVGQVDTQPRPRAAEDTGAESADPETSHVLLSNYQQRGPAH